MFKYSLVVIVLFLIILTTLLFDFKDKEKIIIDKKIEYDFLDLKNKAALYYFGYVGCDSVCPARLGEISKVYNELEKQMVNKLDIVFVNMKKVLDKENVDIMAKYYNKNFKGVNILPEEARALQSDFNLYMSDGLLNVNEINHSSFVYFVCKTKSDYRLISMYMKLKKENIVDDLKRCLEYGKKDL